ncbi:unnamed protein product [Paramecium sonneborni]|uniref:Uncharacterized protein n=1 Tax=Paramecium sonneborni TaxID=65129 RepID=A0A8S1RVX7_9CILI|nr:unnamed protein product [Paramecium sonneborni]
MQSEKQVKFDEKIDQAIEFCQNESQNSLLINCSECDNLHNEGFQEFSILSYICREEQVLQYHSKIKRHFSKNKEMLYYYDGQLIKMYLNWVGEYGNNKRKTGKWIATWKGENLDVGGFYGSLFRKIKRLEEENIIQMQLKLVNGWY